MKQEMFPPIPMLGVASMDTSHRVLFDAVEQVLNAPDAKFTEFYSMLVASIERDFAAEEQLMEEIDFSGLPAHREQHARVLGGLHISESRVRAGDITIGREALTFLLPWLQVHIPTMDGALAVALQLSEGSDPSGRF